VPGPDPRQRFADTAEAAQRIAGLIAARSRGDLAGADTLLAGMDNQARAAGAVFLAELAIALLAHAEHRPVDEVAAELSLHIASAHPPP
jgi:hypothetical protein